MGLSNGDICQNAISAVARVLFLGMQQRVAFQTVSLPAFCICATGVVPRAEMVVAGFGCAVFVLIHFYAIHAGSLDIDFNCFRHYINVGRLRGPQLQHPCHYGIAVVVLLFL